MVDGTSVTRPCGSRIPAVDRRQNSSELHSVLPEFCLRVCCSIRLTNQTPAHTGCDSRHGRHAGPTTRYKPMTIQHQHLKRFIQFTHLHIPLERAVFTYLGACFGIGLAVSFLLITLVLLLTLPSRADSTLHDNPPSITPYRQIGNLN